MKENNCKCVVCGLKHYKPAYRLKALKRGVTCSKECADKLQTTGHERTPNYKCVVCGKAHYQRPSQIKQTVYGLTCSVECGKINRAKHMKGKGNHQFNVKGKDNASFTGEKKISNYGYVLIYKPEHIYSNHAGYVFEHILVVEKKIGRHLKRPKYKKDWEVCHHKDRCKTNNSIDNLQLITHGEHIALHIKEDKDRALKAGKTRSIISDIIAREIREKYSTGKFTQDELGKKYNVSQSVICNIINKGRYSYGKV